MINDPFSDLISIDEAASHAGLSKRHVRLLLEKGMILGEKIGRDWITTKEQVDRYLNTNPKPGPKSNKD